MQKETICFCNPVAQDFSILPGRWIESGFPQIDLVPDLTAIRPWAESVFNSRKNNLSQMQELTCPSY